MTTPDFVLELRRHVGHAPLWMPGCTAVVLRPADSAPAAPGWSLGDLDARDVEVLCVRRADDGAWTPVTGIVDPGEEPAAAAEREVLEEADVRARAVRLLGVEVVGPVTYGNGDVTTYLDVAFACEWEGGRPRPADGENTEARFVRADRLPEMNARFTRTVARALGGEAGAAFVR
ncbi:NUDIX domain-containing protein [Actinomyces sp. B33]|uniref:NUDIX hydrolase n=1 Tax=Actinomyces sp. B33 TaxID=2942131 RepID=UPI002342825D|nr:NUDIX domain-containing protein [Actinomyces sp. B33]MDC4232275.1 NUDIX domain-containing protein [Actinomyces sp. B33]